MGNRSHAVRRIGFDSVGFMVEVEKVAKNFGMTMSGVAREISSSGAVLSRMRAGKTWGDAAVIAALAAWSGVNPGLFATRKEPGGG
jgi:hypothetical protein